MSVLGDSLCQPQTGPLSSRGIREKSQSGALGSPCVASAQLCCPPSLCPFSPRACSPCSRTGRMGAPFSLQPQQEVAVLCWSRRGATHSPPSGAAVPAEPRLAPPSRSRAGPDGNLAPCAAARGRLHDLSQPRASPCHTHKKCRTRSMT